MPIEYKSYGCQYKCGYRHNTNKRRIERHESECWKNVENQTCETCDFNTSQYEYREHQDNTIVRRFARSCDHEHGQDLIDRNYDQLKLNPPLDWVKPVVHCPFHSSISDEERQLQENFWDSND